MNLSRRHLLGMAAASLLVAACATVETPPETTIYLVRHAEKLTGDDPSLTEAGHARARTLADSLTPAALTRIYSTDTARTRQTAAPTAEATGLPVTFYKGDELESLAADLKSAPGTVLIVGHSNTTPDLVALLGGDPGAPIDEAAEYDRLYVLQIRGENVTTDLRRYGAPYQP